jgi:hypothetical protein
VLGIAIIVVKKGKKRLRKKSVQKEEINSEEDKNK